jgi:transposase-like protein
MKKQYSETLKMYAAGLSIQAIADFYGVTRQAMWKIMQRRGCEFRPKIQPGEANRFHRGTKASDRAQNLLETAIQQGIVQRKTHCENCSDTGTFKDGRTKIQAHHADYGKPLEVAWLCQKCHHEWHMKNKAKGA